MFGGKHLRERVLRRRQRPKGAVLQGAQCPRDSHVWLDPRLVEEVMRALHQLDGHGGSTRQIAGANVLSSTRKDFARAIAAALLAAYAPP